MAEFAINKEFDGSKDPTGYAQNERLMHQLAFKAHQRMTAAGHGGMEYEDMFQEVAIIYCKCVEGFDPSSGFRFSTYFVTSFWRDFAKKMETLYKKKPVEAVSLSGMMEDEDDDALETVGIDTEGYAPDDYLWQKQAIAHASKRLDGLSRKVLESMVAPSVELMSAVAEHNGRTNVVLSDTADGPKHAFQHVLRTDFVIRHLTRGHNLSDAQIKTLARKVRGAFNEVAAELEAM